MSAEHDDRQTSRSLWSMTKRMSQWARADWPLWSLALVCAPASAALTVLQPVLMMRAIDEAIPARDLDGLKTLALFYLGAVVVSFILEATYNLAISWAAMRTITRVRASLYAHTLSLGRSVFDRVPTGRLLTRVTSDVESLGETLTAGAVTIVLDVLLVLGVLGAMFALDAKLTLILLLLSPVLVVIVDMIRRALRRLFGIVRSSLSELNAFTAERLNGLEIVQLYGDQARALAGFDARLAVYRDANVRSNFWDALLYAIVDGLTSVCMGLMLWYGGGDLVQGAVTAGLLAAFIDYISKLFAPIREFSAKLAILQRASAAMEKILDLLDTDERVQFGEVERDTLDTITLRDVRFRYGPNGDDVLRGLDLTIAPGQVVALVGRTGSGKTTVGKLLTRTYDGARGEIAIGAQPLSALSEASLRRLIGVVSQDVQLFPGTVRFNLTLGAARSDAVLTDAIHSAQADDLVHRLGGLDGLISDKGANISVGEAQLLSFARALASETPFVILDEATASVDSLTEQRLQAATDAILAKRTVLVIAHRLSTIVDADEIIVLDEGRVLERGTHVELLRARGAYATLFRQQFASTLGVADVG